MSENYDSEKEVLEKIKLRWLMIQNSRDDPVLEAYLIGTFEDLYRKYSIKMSNEISEFIKAEKERTKDVLKDTINKKKAQLNSLIEKKKQEVEKKLEQEKKKEEEKMSAGMTRTQQIFGDNF